MAPTGEPTTEPDSTSGNAGASSSGSGATGIATDLTRHGDGVVRLGEEVVFVAGLLPGERARIRIVHRSRRRAVGEIIERQTQSDQRRRPPCILAGTCGGCSLQSLADAGQAAWKQAMVSEVMRRIGGITLPCAPLLVSEARLGYRNRALIPLERGEDGRIRAGYYRRGTHRIVNMNRCPVLDPRIDALIAPIKADLSATDWPVDRHGTGEGGLRHLGLRLGHHTGEMLITLISGHERLPGLEPLVSRWMDRWPELVGVGLNLQSEPTNRLLGQQTRTLAGRPWLEERFGGLRYRIEADTFFQVNTPQAERLIPLLLEALGAPAGFVIDAYSGIGTYSLPLAAAGWQVEGIESHPGSVELARTNAALNGLESRANFSAADVGTALPARLPGARGLILDPPRRGLEPHTVAAILSDPPPLLLYLSCDPGTLARDVRLLSGPEGRFRLEALHPVDFFPQTTHVEVLAVLRRRP